MSLTNQPWRELPEAEARKLSPEAVQARKLAKIKTMSDEELVQKTIFWDCTLAHVTELPPMNEYYEFRWIPRKPEAKEIDNG